MDFDYYDPYVPEIPNTRNFTQLTGKKCINLSENTIKNYDVCLMLTSHNSVPYEMIAKNAKCIVDTRNCMANYKPNCKVVKS